MVTFVALKVVDFLAPCTLINWLMKLIKIKGSKGYILTRIKNKKGSNRDPFFCLPAAFLFGNTLVTMAETGGISDGTAASGTV